jgi:F-type H+-transporting ATPase subunit b
VLDSWVRFESQARESEQRDLVKHVIEKVLQDVQDPKLQKDILADAVANVEGVYFVLYLNGLAPF